MDVILQSVQANQTYALLNPLDLYETEVASKLSSKVPTPTSLNWLKKMEGRMSTRKTKRSVYSLYEEGQYMAGAAKIGVVTPNGAKFDITMSDGYGSVSAANANSFVVENMLVMFSDGKTTGFVETVNKTTPGAHVVTIKKTDASQDIATAAVVGTNMVFFSNAQPEGSTATQSRVEQYTKLTNKLHIIREFFDVTDEEMYNQAWFEPVPGKKYLWYKGIQATANRFELQKQLALLISNQSTSLTDKNANVVQTTHGMIPQIRTGGAELEYFVKPDGAGFDEVMLHLDNSYGENKYFIGEGHNLMMGLKDFLVKFAQNGTGNISFSPFTGGSEQAIKLDFKSYSVGDYEFYNQKWSILSHKDTLGADGFPFRHMGIFIPAGVTRDANPELAEGSPNYVPYLVMVTPPLSAFSANPNIVKEDYLMWETGAFANQGATSDAAKKGVHFLAYVGLEMRCRNKWLLWQQA